VPARDTPPTKLRPLRHAARSGVPRTQAFLVGRKQIADSAARRSEVASKLPTQRTPRLVVHQSVSTRDTRVVPPRQPIVDLARGLGRADAVISTVDTPILNHVRFLKLSRAHILVSLRWNDNAAVVVHPPLQQQIHTPLRQAGDARLRCQCFRCYEVRFRKRRSIVLRRVVWSELGKRELLVIADGP